MQAQVQGLGGKGQVRELVPVQTTCAGDHGLASSPLQLLAQQV